MAASLLDRLRAFINPTGTQSAQFAINRGIATWQGQDGQSFVRDGYAGNDIVYSVIHLITDRAKVAPWAVYKEKNKAKAKQYKALMKSPDKIQDWHAAEQLKNEAYEVYTGDALLNELLTYPNQEDTWADLMEAWLSFKLVCGNAFIYAKQIEAGANMGKPLTLTALPSQFMSIYADIQAFPAVKTGYQLYIGRLVEFTLGEILHDKYVNLQWDAVGGELYGMSPLKAAAKNLTRSNEAKTAAVAQFQNGGPDVVMYMDDDRFDPVNGSDQVEAMKKKLAENAGSKNKGKVINSGWKVGVHKIGLSPVDLNIIESEKWDMRAIANIYGVPSQLLNDSEGKTYNNVREAQKELIVRAVLPLLVSARDNFNRMLHTMWGYKGSGLMVDFSLDAYPELVADRKDQVEYLNTAWWIPPAQKNNILGVRTPDYIDPADMQRLYIPSNIAPIDDFPQL
jgi:HK97 family phage portal protein